MKNLADHFRSAGPPPRPRLRLDIAGTLVYAIGDVHGCMDKLKRLEAKIVADSSGFAGRKLIIMLGDYVDRGPASAEVIAHLMSEPPDGFERICLTGNHEMIMLDFLDGRCELGQWLALGGGPTLASYGVDLDRLKGLYSRQRDIDAAARAAVPQAHADFLRTMPVLAETDRFIFVHAGFRPDIPLDEQADDELVSIREGFYSRAGMLHKTVVHGHTPVQIPKLEGHRLNIDTGAWLGWPMTAARIAGSKGRFIRS